MNIHEREMAPALAARAVFGYYEKFRGRDDRFGDHRESAEALGEILCYLQQMDTWGEGEKGAFYYHLREGLPDELDPERIYGDIAFELLVQFALAHDAFAVTPRVLRFTRAHAQAIHDLGSIDAIMLARAVTATCRERYGQHLEPATEPPEKLAPPLGRDRAGEIALRYLVWVADGPLRKNGHPSDIDKVVLAGKCSRPRDRVSLLHDLREGCNIEPPKNSPRKSGAWASYRRNCQTALAVSVEDFSREGFTAEDVVSERAWILAQEIGASLEEAFGFLRSIAIRSRDR